MMRVALLRNAKSTQNLGRPCPHLVEEVTIIDLKEQDDTIDVLQRLNEQAVDVLVIDGGDGTVRTVLTHAAEVFQSTLPFIGILRHGNTNLIADHIGHLSGYEDVERLCKLTQDALLLRSKSARMLRLDFEDSDRSSVRGFIMGWGAYTSATRIGLNEVKQRGGTQVITTVVKTLYRALVGGRNVAKLKEGVEAYFKTQSNCSKTVRRFIGIATTIDGPLTAGLNPFWGNGDGPIRWLDVAAPAKYLLFAAPLAAFGKSTNWMKKAGYHSGRSDTLHLKVEGGIVVDGDIFETEITNKIIISGAETFRFIGT